jgi:hypothetical protein
MMERKKVSLELGLVGLRLMVRVGLRGIVRRKREQLGTLESSWEL